MDQELSEDKKRYLSEFLLDYVSHRKGLSRLRKSLEYKALLSNYKRALSLRVAYEDEVRKWWEQIVNMRKKTYEEVRKELQRGTKDTKEVH